MDNINRILLRIENKASKNFLPIIGPVKGQVLVHTIEKVKPKRILEVGTLVGYSAILIAKHLPPNSKIITLEIDKNLAKIAKKNISETGLQDRIEIIVGDAKKTIKKLAEKFNVLFLDAKKTEYLTYLKLAEPKLSPKAVVIADNVKIFAKDLKKFLEYVRKSGRYNSQTFDFGQDAVEVSVKL